MASPERAARLHRRLRTASAQARLAAARPGGELATLASDLGEEAAAIERDLVSAARSHRSLRRQVLSEPERRIADVERAATALTMAARAHASSTRHVGLDGQSRVQSIEERAAILRSAAHDVDAAQWSSGPVPLDGARPSSPDRRHRDRTRRDPQDRPVAPPEPASGVVIDDE